ncbi:antibiotic biosynthesis monooxygenase [Rhizobium sp. XQZ8]|uniref:putative quinol monooxygenase n=1 Tax=Rhizobium populisoli TaxID=2859785 RepID=UPI001C675C20|nr:putative quinol monooxygenase [Rhizobium populisoli]MBW6421373.1 antibiotic biosynthesis monooxygenase [Rhizobium populisoli]
MPVTYLIRFHIRAEQRSRFMTLLNGILDAMRHEPMFHNAMLHVDPQDENQMMLYETWEDHDDVLNVQINRPYRETWHAALPDLLAKEREISIWHPVRDDRRGAINR